MDLVEVIQIGSEVNIQLIGMASIFTCPYPHSL
jgi:hypothetical protein